MKSNILEFKDWRGIEEEAWNWIIKLEGDTSPTKEDIACFQEWLAQSEDHKTVFKEITTRWNDMDILSELVIPPEKKEQTLSSGLVALILWILSPLTLIVSVISVTRKNTPPIVGASLAIASSVGIAFALVLMFSATNSNYQAQYTTGIGEQITIPLKDGSTLRLNTNSLLQIDFKENIRRINLQKGEVHFDVAHDPNRPFEIYANDRLVRAVGTAFSVLIKKDDIKVTVTEGKVELGLLKSKPDPKTLNSLFESVDDTSNTLTASPTNINEEIIGALTAGQSVVILAQHEGDLTNIQQYEEKEMRRQLAWLKGKLIFAGEPLHEVIEEVSRYSSIHIEIMDENIADIRIGGQFQVGQTEGFFDVLELGFGLNVLRVNVDHVQISAIADTHQ